MKTKQTFLGVSLQQPLSSLIFNTWDIFSFEILKCSSKDDMYWRTLSWASWLAGYVVKISTNFWVQGVHALDLINWTERSVESLTTYIWLICSEFLWNQYQLCGMTDTVPKYVVSFLGGEEDLPALFLVPVHLCRSILQHQSRKDQKIDCLVAELLQCKCCEQNKQPLLGNRDDIWEWYCSQWLFNNSVVSNTWRQPWVQKK